MKVKRERKLTAKTALLELLNSFQRIAVPVPSLEEPTVLWRLLDEIPDKRYSAYLALTVSAKKKVKRPETVNA